MGEEAMGLWNILIVVQEPKFFLSPFLNNSKPQTNPFQKYEDDAFSSASRMEVLGK